MKETLYTIPINDGFNEGGECPFCNMYKKLEQESIDYTLGASYMEDDVRAVTDKLGFCSHHSKMLYDKQNRLGMALIMQSHIQKITNNLETLNSKFAPNKKSLFSKSKQDNTLVSYLDNTNNSCFVCDKINNSFDRYISTFFYMWKKDNDIKLKVQNSKGFCLNHLSILLSLGEKSLSAKEYEEFVKTIMPLELDNLKRLLREVDHFVNKFDHNYANAPWGSAKDSLIRAIQKTASIFVED